MMFLRVRWTTAVGRLPPMGHRPREGRAAPLQLHVMGVPPYGAPSA